jgi:hypothetical protein
MAARHGHFGMEELRNAVEAITRTPICFGVPGIFTGIGDETGNRSPELIEKNGGRGRTPTGDPLHRRIGRTKNQQFARICV